MLFAPCPNKTIVENKAYNLPSAVFKLITLKTNSVHTKSSSSAQIQGCSSPLQLALRLLSYKTINKERFWHFNQDGSSLEAWTFIETGQLVICNPGYESNLTVDAEEALVLQSTLNHFQGLPSGHPMSITERRIAEKNNCFASVKSSTSSWVMSRGGTEAGNKKASLLWDSGRTVVLYCLIGNFLASRSF